MKSGNWKYMQLLTAAFEPITHWVFLTRCWLKAATCCWNMGEALGVLSAKLGTTHARWWSSLWRRSLRTGTSLRTRWGFRDSGVWRCRISCERNILKKGMKFVEKQKSNRLCVAKWWKYGLHLHNIDFNLYFKKNVRKCLFIWSKTKYIKHLT